MEREITRENMVEKGCTISRDQNLRGGLVVDIGSRWARDDDGEDTVLHIRDNLLDLSFWLEWRYKEQRNGEGEL